MDCFLGSCCYGNHYGLFLVPVVMETIIRDCFLGSCCYGNHYYGLFSWSPPKFCPKFMHVTQYRKQVKEGAAYSQSPEYLLQLLQACTYQEFLELKKLIEN